MFKNSLRLDMQFQSLTIEWGRIDWYIWWMKSKYVCHFGWYPILAVSRPGYNQFIMYFILIE